MSAQTPHPFARRDAIRLDVCSPFLARGAHGIEIGAGAFPSLLPAGVTCEYFDRLGPAELSDYFKGAALPPTRPLAEIPLRFPDGSPFLIAHNVLEHTPDPIGTLLQWFRHVRAGGFVILSLPDRAVCSGDSRRPAASIQHLLLDYAFRETDTSLQSREHFIAGCVGWASDWHASKDEFASGILEAANRPHVEHHFHVFDDALARAATEAALYFFGTGRIVAFASPSSSTRTDGDIVLVVKMAGTPVQLPAVQETTTVLAAALGRLDGTDSRVNASR